MILRLLRNLRRLLLRLAPAWHPTRIAWIRASIAFCVAWLRPSVIKTRHGFALRIPRGDGSPIVQALFFDGEYEPEETRAIRDILEPGDVAVDVGANVGYMTCLMALAVGDQGAVHCFEPEPHLFSTLEANVELNRMPRVQARRAALSARSSDSHLYLNPANPGDHSLIPLPGREAVAITTEAFDDYWRQHGWGRSIRLIKIDVQGYELEVLRGMLHALRRGTIENLLIEIWPHRLRQAGASCRAVLDLLPERSWKWRILSATGSEVAPSLSDIRSLEANLADSPHFAFNLLATRASLADATINGRHDASR